MDILSELGVTAEAKFVPGGLNGNLRSETPTINWIVRVLRHGREIVQVPFSQPYVFAPEFAKAKRLSIAVVRECETGVRYGSSHWRLPDPPLDDVFYALLQDAHGSDATFEDWAEEFGLNPDSRKAEAAWKQRREIAAALRQSFTADELARLYDTFSAY